QYPGVADSLHSDLAVVKPVALQMLGLSDAEVEPYFAEVKLRLLEETDYSLELERSLALSGATMGKVPGIRFPTYYPEFSNRRVLTMDWVEGRPLDQYADENLSEEERNEVAQAIWDFYHFQIHELKQFHADPHPGNFLVDEATEVVVLDFGCTKSLDAGFHEDYFRFLDLEVLNDSEAFEAGLRKLEVLSDEDSPRERQLILEEAERGARLLGRPFHEGEFDFGDETYMASIFEMGEAQRKNSELKEMRTARGSADSIYLNRAYFGLYSLMGLLRAKIRTER
ncbi:MAG: AarF/UbiB family protein, partial [Verrucomicrobiota bacterium]